MSVVTNEITRPSALKMSPRWYRSAIPPHTGAAHVVPSPVRWCFLLAIFALPYEYANLGVMDGADVVKISGALLVLLYGFYYGVSRGRSYGFPGRPFWCFLAYVVIFTISALLDTTDGGLSIALTLAQLLVFFWISADLLKSPAMTRQALLTYTTASFVLACGTLAEIPGFSRVVDGRVAAVGDNPNSQAQHMALGILILIELIAAGLVRQITRKCLALGMVLILLAAMAGAGSRSAMLALGFATIVYVLPYYRSKKVFISAVLGLITIAGGIYLITTNRDFLQRWDGAYNEGDSAGRDDIYSTALGMIAEKPLTGWGPVTAFYELGTRLGITTGRDAHNLILDLLLGLGIIGAVPLLLGILLCIRVAWLSRASVFGLLPLTLLAANLAASMFHTNIVWKAQWLVFALTLREPASGYARRVRAIVAQSRQSKRLSAA